jgi:hypothetical protein
MLRFLIGIICILLHRPKKLTLFTYFVVTNQSSRVFQTSEDPDDQVIVQLCQMGKNTIRICLHLDNSDNKTIDQICKKLRFVFNEIKK